MSSIDICSHPDEDTRVAMEKLATPAQFVKGVGPQRAVLLERLNLRTAQDILFFFPRDYEVFAAESTPATWRENDVVTFRGTVEEVEMRGTGVGRSLLGVLLCQGAYRIRAIWFNQPYMQQRFRTGQHLLLNGSVRLRGMTWEMSHPQIQFLNSATEQPSQSGILPLYGLTDGLRQSAMRRIVHGVVEEYVRWIPEVLPEEILDTYQLWPIRAALPQIHRPVDAAGLQAARRRFVFQELLVWQLALALRRQQGRNERRSPSLPAKPAIDARIRQLLPFELTAAQNGAIAEIAQDMAQPVPMNRLLHGDVGSGKTAVALYAMLVTVAHGYQAVLMAPTEILARQHFENLQRLLRGSQVNLQLLTGNVPAQKREQLIDEVKDGRAHAIIGTHAIVQADIPFQRLGLVVIDEQHKFGVRQRAILKRAGEDPHYLVMTATPIPRTLTMSLYGDLDVTTLRDSIPGRQPVHTYWATPQQRDRWWEFFRRKLREGRQGYVITPLVESTDDETELASAAQVYADLTAGPLADFRLDLVHGRMSGAEKQGAMESFRAGKTQVLVATSVVEVGVDVPNATLMAIENSERFGLAQLHQLRGRVRRGTFPGFVCAFTGEVTAEGEQRLQAFVNSTDGFELAEVDFRIRGPGDLFGTRQHGLPPLRVADLVRDEPIMLEARRAACERIVHDPQLQNPAYQRLRHMVLKRYSATLELSQVG